MFRQTLALFALVAAPAVAAAQPQKFVRDDNHSTINFAASSRLLDAQGYWSSWTADITADPAAWENTKLAITIDAKSVNTRVDMRDNHLRSCAFFCVDSFPQITFVSTLVNKLSDTKLNITGDLTIRGVTKRITVPSTLVFWDAAKNQGRVKGTITILRKDFGVSFDPPVNPVENEVPVSFDITFRKPAPPRN